MVLTFCREAVGVFYSPSWLDNEDAEDLREFVPRLLLFVTDYLTKMGIKTVPHPPYSPDSAPYEFWLFPKLKKKLRSCRYETIEEMKEAVTKVIDTLTQEDFHGAFQKLLERYNKCISRGGDYFEGD